MKLNLVEIRVDPYSKDYIIVNDRRNDIPPEQTSEIFNTIPD